MKLTSERQTSAHASPSALHRRSSSAGIDDMPPIKDTSTWQPWLRWHLARVLTSHVFDAFMAIVIILNLVLVVLQADSTASGLTATRKASSGDGSGAGQAEAWLEVSAQMPLLIYVIELCARIFVWHWDFFNSHDHVFDFVIVTLDASLFALSAIVGNLPNAALLRVVKLTKLVKTLRVLHGCHELKVIIQGFTGSMRSLIWGCVMLFVTTLLFGIIAVEMLHPLVLEVEESGGFEGCSRCPSAFSSVFESMLTIVQQIFAGDSWGTLCIPLITAHPWTTIPLLFILITINLGILNLLVASVVDNANEVRANDQEAKLLDKEKKLNDARTSLKILCEAMDSDHSGMLSFDEIVNGYDHDERFFDMMRTMDVERSDLKTTFNLMDLDRSGTVSADEFVEEIHKMKTQETHSMLIFIKAHIQETQEELHALIADVLKEVKKDFVTLRQQAIDDHHVVVQQLQQGCTPVAQAGGGPATCADQFPPGPFSSSHVGGGTGVAALERGREPEKLPPAFAAAPPATSTATASVLPAVGVTFLPSPVADAPPVSKTAAAPVSKTAAALQQAARFAEAQSVAIEGLRRQADELALQVLKISGEGSEAGLEDHDGDGLSLRLPTWPPAPFVDDDVSAAALWPDLPRGQPAYAAGMVIGSRLDERPVPWGSTPPMRLR